MPLKEEPEFDAITRLAALQCEAPCSIISMLDNRNQYLKSHYGIAIKKTTLKESFCVHATQSPQKLFIVEDTRKNPLLKNHSAVNSEKPWLFYAAISLYHKNGEPFGTLAILDYKPRTLSAQQKELFKNLAVQAQQLIKMRAKERELKNSNTKLARKSQRLNNIIEATEAGTWEWNVQTGEIIINERWAQMIGYTTEELKPHDINVWYRILHPEDRTQFDETIQDCLDEKTDYYNVECRLIHKKGHTVWVNDRGKVVQRTPDGQPLWMMGTHTDITRQKREEERLRILEGGINKANDIVLVSRAEGLKESDLCLTYINEALTRVTGYKEEEVLGKAPNFLRGKETTNQQVEQLENAILRGESIEVNLLNYKKGGEPFWSDTSINPIKDKAGHITHWISVKRNVTQQKNEQLCKQLTSALGAIFSEEETLLKAINAFLKYLTGLGKITLAEVWMVSEAKKTIDLKAQVTTTQLLNKHFSNSKVPRVFQYGEGLPGVVWKKEKLQKWCNLGENPHFVRKKQAQNTGLNCGMGLPLVVKDEVVGVLLLASGQTKDEFSFYNQIYRDICNPLAAEIQRKKPEEELYQIHETAPDIICTADFEGRFQRINPAATRLLGYSRDELLELSLDKLIHPDDRASSRQAFEKLLAGEGVTYFENRYLTAKGAIVHLAWSATAQIDETKIYAVAKDITEKKKMEIRLIASNKSLQDIKYALDLTTNIIVTDFDGYILEVNDSTCRLSGYSRKELIGAHTRINNSGAHPEEFFEEMWNTIKAGKIWRGEIKNKHKDGSYYWVDTTIVPLSNEDGILTRFMAIRVDITERAQLRDLLRKTNEFARIGSWEVNLNSGFVYWSPVVRAIHEVPTNFKPTLKKALAFYHPDFKKQVSEQVNRCMETGKPFDYEAVIITQNEKERWVRAVGQAEMAEGKCIWIYGTIQDIHDRKSAQLRLKHTANNLPGAIFQFLLYPDGTHRIENLTEGALQLWGETAQKCMEDTNVIWQQLKTGGDYDLVWEAIMQSAERLENWHCSYRSRKPNGELMWHEAFGKPQKLADGSVLWDSLIIDITSEKKNEILLEEASSLAKIGSWEVNMQAQEPRYIYCSAMTCAILDQKPGFKPEFHEGFGAFAGNGRKELEVAMQQLIDSGREYDVEVQLITTSGLKKWVRCIGQADHYEGKCLRIYGGMQDVSDQKLAKLALQEAFDERNEILESIGDAFFAVDKNWVVTYWNYEAETNLGVSRQEMVGANLWDKFPDARKLAFYERYQLAMRTGREEQFEAYYPAVAKWFEVSAYPNEKGLSVYFKNVTERHEAQQKLKESNERFEKVAQATNDVIWDYNVIKDKLYWGERFQIVFGHSINKKPPGLQDWRRHLHPEDKAKVTESFDHALVDTDAENWQMEYRFAKADGSYASVIDRGIIMRDDKGKALRMVGAMTDITQRKTHEESLKRLNKRIEERARALAISNAELEQFAYVASHDLQEPLRMVSSFLTQLEKKYGEVLDEKAQRYIQFAVDGAKRMRQIILDLLDFSRVGKHRELLEEVPINTVLEEVQRLLHREISSSGARIIYENMPVVRAFKTPLLHIFQNLIGNAIRYRKESQSPMVKITAKKRKGEWLFAVSDNGIGIAEEFYDKIFVIFQRLHRQDQYSGTGMGLPIVKKQLESMGGKVWLKSKEGEGSTFYFTLPEKIKEMDMFSDNKR